MFRHGALLLAIATLVAGCSESSDTTPAVSASTSAVVGSADMVFYGDHILTMDPESPSAEAVAIDDGRIVFVGPRAAAQAYVASDTRVVELGDKALVPGLIDAHGHFMMMARLADVAQLYPPPVGSVDSIDRLVDAMQAHLAANPPAEGQWLAGFGYDDSLLKEGRHPTRQDLDRVSTDVPVVAQHVSGHLSAVNSKALEVLGISATTPDPDGGVIRREDTTGTPNGVLEETASHPAMYRIFMQPSAEDFRAKVDKAIGLYASMGITTIQDGASMPSDIAMMKALAAEQPFAADIAFFPQIGGFKDEAELDAFRHETVYTDGMRVAGVKFVLDGSPQGRTAWMTHAYHALPDGAEEGYVAYPAYDTELYDRQLATLLRNRIPVLAHANGDAAIDAMLEGIERAFPEGDIPDHRSVIIHAQLMRRDQIDRAGALGAIPSYFSAHTFFWGDWHRQSFGEERASGISPTASSIEKGVRFSVHNDSPVVLPDMMRLLWATVNRTTRSGYTLGRGERISAHQALRAMTLDAAYQYFEDDSKGTLTTGKQADLVILSADPEQVAAETIADIRILETISHGKTIYTAP